VVCAARQGNLVHRAAMGKQLAARVVSLDRAKIEDGYRNIEV
jgi:hypothetical protein